MVAEHFYRCDSALSAYSAVNLKELAIGTRICRSCGPYSLCPGCLCGSKMQLRVLGRRSCLTAWKRPPTKEKGMDTFPRAANPTAALLPLPFSAKEQTAHAKIDRPLQPIFSKRARGHDP